MKTHLRGVAVAGLVAISAIGFAGHAAAQARRAGAPPAGRETWKRGQNWDKFVRLFDANHDGKVSKEELLAKHPGFDRADANHDGSVTADEMKALPAAQRHPGLAGAGFISRFDQDGDGKVTLDEFNAKRTAAFDAMDKNKDGFISQEEFQGEAANGEGEELGM